MQQIKSLLAALSLSLSLKQCRRARETSPIDSERYMRLCRGSQGGREKTSCSFLILERSFIPHLSMQSTCM